MVAGAGKLADGVGQFEQQDSRVGRWCPINFVTGVNQLTEKSGQLVTGADKQPTVQNQIRWVQQISSRWPNIDKWFSELAGSQTLSQGLNDAKDN